MPCYCYQDVVYTLPELRAKLPGLSLPDAPTAEALAPWGITLVPAPEPGAETLLEQARAARLAALAQAFEHAERFSHFASPSLGFEVDANERAHRDVQGLLTILQASGEDAAMFCDYGNVMHEVTLEQLAALQLELILYGQALYARKWELRDAILKAASPEEINAVEINFDTLPAPVLTNGEKA